MTTVTMNVNGVNIELVDKWEAEGTMSKKIIQEFSNAFDAYLRTNLNISREELELHLREIFPEKQL
jgi:hypothetical protein